MPDRRSCRRARSSSRDSLGISCRAIDEIAVEGELTNQGVDLAEGERHRRATFEIASEKTIRRHAELESRCGGIFDDRGAMLLRQCEHAEDATDSCLTLVSLYVLADGAHRGADAERGFEQCDGFRRVRFGRSDSSMRCQPRGARRCSRSSWPVLGSSSRTCRSFHCTSTRRQSSPAGRDVRGTTFAACISSASPCVRGDHLRGWRWGRGSPVVGQVNQPQVNSRRSLPLEKQIDTDPSVAAPQSVNHGWS